MSSLTGGCRCSYKNCTNTTKTENIHFFHYPVKHKERCTEWINSAGKPQFYNLEEEVLRNKVICELHFEEKWFPNNQRKRLLQGAVPTLDGINHEETFLAMKTESPPYISSSQYNASYNQYSDVKVLPANDDGTVFVLDTENMFTRSAKIESYIIKNGVLVPTNLNNAPVKSKSRQRASTSSTPTTSFYSASEREIASVNTPPGPAPGLAQLERPKGPSRQYIKHEANLEAEEASQDKPGDNEFLIYDNDSNEMQRIEIHNESDDSKPNPANLIRQIQVAPTQTQSGSQPNVAKNVNKSYLRKIKQHSREIATIKRMLKQQKRNEPKPDNKTVINVLQDQIPPSMFTVLGLALGEKNDLNEDDIEFFTSLHKTSPEVYQLLTEKYKWNLPNMVEAPSE